MDRSGNVNGAAAYYNHDTSLIAFRDEKARNNKFIRAHEVGHKVTASNEKNNYSSGFHVSKQDPVTGYKTQIGLGRCFDEGATNLLAEKLSGVPIKYEESSLAYFGETRIAKQVMEIVG